MLEVFITVAGLVLVIAAAFLVYVPLGLAVAGALFVYLGAFVDWDAP